MSMIIAPSPYKLVQATDHRVVVHDALGFEYSPCLGLQSLHRPMGWLDKYLAVLVFPHILPEEIKALSDVGNVGLLFRQR